MAWNFNLAVLCLVLCVVFVPSRSLAADCKDKFQRPYCQRNTARCGSTWMNENCALTCGICTNQHDHDHHQPATNYQWSSWTAWSSCSKSCESGKMRRIRGCPVSLTMCGLGESIQFQSCNTHTCLIGKPTTGDCKDRANNCQELKELEYCMKHMPWMRKYCEKTCEFCETTEVDWSPWSECSRSCGGGIKTRHEENCHKDGSCMLDSAPCNTQPCKVEWLSWSGWSSCSVSCGQGVQNRKRECLLFGCKGDSSESKSCFLRTCEGSWLSWSSWSDCTTTCNTGSQKRFRGCRDLDLLCSGPTDDVRLCIENPACNAEWMLWSSWSDCSTTCGDGKQERTRMCSIADAICSGDAYESKDCVDNPSCFGEWLAWSSWTECSASCGEGVQNRFRNCTNDNCVGEATAIKTCELKLCEGSWLSWGAWSECPTTCGAGMQTRYRVCNEPNLPCTGSSFESKNCTENPKCPDIVSPWGGWSKCSATCGTGEMMRVRNCRDIHCIDPQMDVKECKIEECIIELNWTEWSACTQSCGGGTRTRLDKRCSTTVPDNSNCGQETEACNTEECLAEFTQWSEWSECSTTCGSGIMRRNRECIGQIFCEEADLFETMICKNNDCFGEYSPWSSWTQCSQTCGQGVKNRNRTCTISNCSDALQQTGNCYPGICPAVWSEWSDWSECSVTCGRGIESRSRNCTTGDNCEGEDIEIQECEQEKCEEIETCTNVMSSEFCERLNRKCDEEIIRNVCKKTCKLCTDNCSCEEWSSWSACTATCSSGHKTRTRVCASNSSKCAISDRKICNLQPCIVEPMCLGGEKRYGSPVGGCCDIDPDEFNTCGNNAVIERVVGGENADEKRWPWVVMVVARHGEICAGTLISWNWVLTAAHCIDHDDPTGIRLKMGMTDWTKEDNEFVQNRRGVNMTIHKDYSMPKNDIGLIEVDVAFEESDYVKKICLPSGEEILTGSRCYVAGWGMYDNNIIQASDELQELSLTTQPLDDCKKAFENTVFGAEINDNMICAGGEEGKDTCNGDSGAPLMCQRCSSCSWYLAGVTSFGSRKCGIKGTPAIYTQVRAYEEWIRSIVDITDQNKSFNNTCY